MRRVGFSYPWNVVTVGLSPEVVSELNQKAVVMSATQALVIGRAAVSLEQSQSSPVLSSEYNFFLKKGVSWVWTGLYFGVLQKWNVW